MISMTYGVMPTRTQFDKACKTPDDSGRTVNSNGFRFGNDPRLGNTTLSSNELWTELRRAHKDWKRGSERAGDWMSAVLGCLGFEWI